MTVVLDAGSGCARVLDNLSAGIAANHAEAVARARVSHVEWQASVRPLDRECFERCCRGRVVRTSPTFCGPHSDEAQVWLDKHNADADVYERGLRLTTIGKRTRLGGRRADIGAPAIAEKKTTTALDWDADDLFGLCVPPWHRLAACRDADPATFFPDAETALAVARAKAFCDRCTVRPNCLLDGLRARDLPFRDHKRLVARGIFGGTSTAERKAMRDVETAKTARAA